LDRAAPNTLIPTSYKRFIQCLLVLALGALIGFGVHWYLTRPNPESALAKGRAQAREVGAELEDTFDTQEIKKELSRTGQVIREKARKAGDAISDAAENARITASIKAKLLQESAMSALAIDVDTTDGVVTLSGAVSSHEQIATAMELAMETEGVHKVISTLQLKPPAQKS
jgi:hypothetical protein